jgi:hypothetical protein
VFYNEKKQLKTKKIKTMVKVKNLNETSDNPPPSGYSSWIEYWKTKTGKKLAICAHPHCNDVTGTNLVGAHVKKVGSNDNSWYIIPLCPEHNMINNEFDIMEELVSVNA